MTSILLSKYDIYHRNDFRLGFVKIYIYIYIYTIKSQPTRKINNTLNFGFLKFIYNKKVKNLYMTCRLFQNYFSRLWKNTFNRLWKISLLGCEKCSYSVVRKLMFTRLWKISLLGCKKSSYSVVKKGPFALICILS